MRLKKRSSLCRHQREPPGADKALRYTGATAVLRGVFQNWANRTLAYFGGILVRRLDLDARS